MMAASMSLRAEQMNAYLGVTDLRDGPARASAAAGTAACARPVALS